MRLPLRFAFFLGGLVMTLAAIATKHDTASGYAVPVVRNEVSDARPMSQFIDLRADTPAAHAGTIVRLSDRNVAAFWFAGSREGAGDVRIFTARTESGRWSTPEPALDVARVMSDEWRFVRKLGNPVAYVDPSGLLHLFFVSVSLGGWATSNLNQVTSPDGGRSWGRARVLAASPFANLSTLARTGPLPRSDGGFDLPVYHEGARKFPELLRFSAQRSNHDYLKIRMGPGRDLLQPAIVAFNEWAAVGLLRDAGGDRQLKAIQTQDGGSTWSSPIPTDQHNPDSSIAVSRLSDGLLLMAYNPRKDGRSELALAVSRDGLRWTRLRSVEFEQGGEFSYPALLADDENEMHLVYTWNRKHIRHLKFNRAWLFAGEKDVRR
jgi:predicted neuraminidase